MLSAYKYIPACGYENMIKASIIAIELIIAWYLVSPIIKLMLVSLKETLGLRDTEKQVTVAKDYDFAAIVTVYQNDGNVPQVVESFKRQVHKNFVCYIVIDKCDGDLTHLQTDNIRILYTPHQLNSKTRSIDFALENFIREHDAVSVFDDDNLVHPDYYKEINRYFNMGYKAVQGAIRAKNTDTHAARLDAINEAFYSFNDRESRQILGLSSSLWGLGYTISTDVFKTFTFDHYLVGYDKKLQVELAMREHIAYAKEAIVFDEKTSTCKNMVKQRARWIYGFFRYQILGLRLLVDSVAKLNLDKLNFGINYMRPPLVLLMIIATLISTANFFFLPEMKWLMPLSIVLFALGLGGILHRHKINRQLWLSLIQMPRFIIVQILALSILRKSAKGYHHTPHVVAHNIDDMLRLHS